MKTRRHGVGGRCRLEAGVSTSKGPAAAARLSPLSLVKLVIIDPISQKGKLWLKRG